MTKITLKKAKTLGNKMKLDWNKYDIKEFRIGLEIEQEHSSDMKRVAQTAIDHLNEFPDYYTELVKFERSLRKRK